jgi:RNA polymerase nonessential primary-like sigma factor
MRKQESNLMDLSKYYEEICRAPLITKEEEYELLVQLHDESLTEKQRQSAREKVLRSHLRFVFQQAKYYSKNDVALFEELIAVGNEGLLVGIDKFKPARGVRCLSYAGFWVKQRILKHLSSLRLVSLPIWKQQLAAKIQKVVDSRADVTLEDLYVEFPDVQRKDLAELFQTKYLTYYIEDMGDDAAFEINPIEAEVEKNLDREKVHARINELPYPHREVIGLFFGIHDEVERSLADVSKELGLSRETVKEVKREALAMLKDSLNVDFSFEEE